MSLILTTQTVTTTSGIRNSGGILNVAGSGVGGVIIGSIFVVPASGQSTAPSFSGIVLAVTHATSGMFAQASGQELFRFDGSSHSGLGTGNLAAVPGSFTLEALNIYCPSGVVTLNSGTHVFDIIVNFRT